MHAAYPLAGLRVLALPGLATAVTAKYLADLGADVQHVVDPHGRHPLDDVGPWVTDAAARRFSCARLALQPGRELPLDLESAAGGEQLARLGAAADVVLHEYTDAEVGRRGFEWITARADHGAVVVAITPFGAAGPLSSWQGSDLVHFAMGGYLYMTGEREGEPLGPSAPLQTYLHAGVQALAATLVALRRRRLTGEGARIDQSIRDTATWMLTHTYQHWDMQRVNLRRNGTRRDMGAKRRLRTLYRAKDGHLVWMFTTGHLGAPSMRRLVDWMREEQADVRPFEGIDWESMDILDRDEGMLSRLESAFEAFFKTRTKAEMLEWCTANGLMLAPVATIPDVWEDPHLHARQSWIERAAPSCARLRLPGPPVRIEGVAFVPPEAAPSPADPWEPRAPSLARPGPATGKPLTGVRVVDLGTTLAAPTVTRHLADLGADVIKVESVAHPDTLRVGTPYAEGFSGLDRSGYFGAYNAGKRSLACDLRTPEGRQLLRRLLERADVLVQNFTPGVLERLGLSLTEIRSWNSRLVVASHCLSGQTGPRRTQRGYGQVAGATTGWYELTGEAHGEPIGPYSAYTDFLSWPFLLSAVLVALEVREATGFAPAIDHAQVESSLHFLAPLLVSYQLSGRPASRRGNHRDDIVPNNAYRCAGDDRWVAISVLREGQWDAVCDVLALDACWRALATREQRAAREPELDAAIAARTREWDAWELATALQSRGVPAGPVHRAQDLFADPQLGYRALFRRLPHEQLGDHAVITHSFRISGVEHGPERGAPLLGEHTEAVLRGDLGMSGEEVAALAASGALA